MEWTIDGAPLRMLYGGEADGSSFSLLREDEWVRDRREESLRRLRDDSLPPPEPEERYHRTRLHRMFGLRGLPVAPAGPAFEDGRVGLLFCYCGDLDCGALSARVEMVGDKVVWRDIAWQVTYEPHVHYDEQQDWMSGPRDLVFDRVAYLSLMDALQAADWSRGLPSVALDDK